jgi:hypothetical protein
MKRLSLYLFLILFTFQTSSQADDIRDFQIEGISLGDSLLDHFSKGDIQRYERIHYTDKKYFFLSLDNLGEIYDRLQVGYKNGDKNYKIELINGVILFKQEIQKCYEKQNKVLEDIKSNFTELSLKVTGPLNQKRKLPNHPKPLKARMYYVDLPPKGSIVIYCSDHPIENNSDDRLKVQIESTDMSVYLASQQ